MKLNQIKESNKKRMGINLSLGGMFGDAKPSPSMKNDIKKLKKHLEKLLVDKFGAEIVGAVTNEFKAEYKIGFAFETEEDRIRAVKHIRQKINSDYVRTVQSIDI